MATADGSRRGKRTERVEKVKPGTLSPIIPDVKEP
jgi:hypothetical protein